MSNDQFEHLTDLLKTLLTKIEKVSDYLYLASDGEDFKYSFFCEEIESAIKQIDLVRHNNRWSDANAFVHTHTLLRRGERVLETAGFSFIKREVSQLIKDLEKEKAHLDAGSEREVVALDV